MPNRRPGRGVPRYPDLARRIRARRARPLGPATAGRTDFRLEEPAAPSPAHAIPPKCAGEGWTTPIHAAAAEDTRVAALSGKRHAQWCRRALPTRAARLPARSFLEEADHRAHRPMPPVPTACSLRSTATACGLTPTPIRSLCPSHPAGDAPQPLLDLRTAHKTASVASKPFKLRERPMRRCTVSERTPAHPANHAMKDPATHRHHSGGGPRRASGLAVRACPMRAPPPAAAA